MTQCASWFRCKSDLRKNQDFWRTMATSSPGPSRVRGRTSIQNLGVRKERKLFWAYTRAGVSQGATVLAYPYSVLVHHKIRAQYSVISMEMVLENSNHASLQYVGECYSMLSDKQSSSYYILFQRMFVSFGICMPALTRQQSSSLWKQNQQDANYQTNRRVLRPPPQTWLLQPLESGSSMSWTIQFTCWSSSQHAHTYTFHRPWEGIW